MNNIYESIGFGFSVLTYTFGALVWVGIFYFAYWGVRHFLERRLEAPKPEELAASAAKGSGSR